MALGTHKIIYEYLKATGTSLYTLCNTRIRQFVAWDTDGNDEAFIVYRAQGGDPSVDVPIMQPRFDFFCYGGSDSWENAWSVEGALRDRLHQATNKTVTSGVIMAAFQVVEGQQAMDKDEWPHIVTTYEMSLKPTG